VFYTLDGSTPDYSGYDATGKVSTLYTGPFQVCTSGTVINYIAGVVGSYVTNEQIENTDLTVPSGTPPNCSGNGAPTNWKCADYTGGGTSVAPTTVTGFGGVPLSGSNCLGTSTVGGLSVTSFNGHCMQFQFTPASGKQNNVLWARTLAYQAPSTSRSTTNIPCADCTWDVSDSYLYYPSTNGTAVSAYEHDDQFFISSSSVSNNCSPPATPSGTVCGYNMQFGHQCLKCDQAGHANWQIGGTTDTPWISTGITQTFAQNQWHHFIKEDHWNHSELTTKPCFNVGSKTGHSVANTPMPCQYYWKFILDSTVYNLQSSSYCTGRPSGSGQAASPPTTGCTITSDYLPVGWSTNNSDQYQIDANTSSPPLIKETLDNANYTAYYDPTPVQTYTVTTTSSTNFNISSSTTDSVVRSDLATTGCNTVGSTACTFTFAGGSYTQNTTSAWQFPCMNGNVFQGASAPLTALTTIFNFTYSSPTNGISLQAPGGSTVYSTPGGGCTVKNIWAQKENFKINSGVSGLLFTNNSVSNIAGKISGSPTYSTSWAGIYIPNGNQWDIQNSSFIGNNFGPSCSDLAGNATDQGGTCGGLVVQGSSQNLIIANNTFNTIEEGIKFLAQSVSNNYGLYANNVSITNNDFNGIMRIGLETQQTELNNFTVFGNSDHDPYLPQIYSMGFSFACCYNRYGASGAAPNVDDNLLYNGAALCSGCSWVWGYGIEAWGYQSQYTRNLIQVLNSNNGINGGIAADGSSSYNSQNLTFANNVLQNVKMICEQQPNNAYPTGCKAVSGITDSNNSYTATISAVTSQAPTVTPSTGAYPSSPISVTINDTESNTKTYCTTDGTTPTTSHYSQIALPNTPVTFQVVLPSTVQCIGMWGQGANPLSYTSGYGYVPSAVQTYSYTVQTPGGTNNGQQAWPIIQ